MQHAARLCAFDHRPSRLAQALAIAFAGMAVLPAGAGIVTGGDVSPNPVTPTVIALGIGNTGAGNVTIDSGSTVAAERLFLGAQTTGDGSLTITGAGSGLRVFVPSGTSAATIDLGQSGRGSISVLNGGSLVNGGTGTTCQTGCRLFISNAAGSNGSLLVSGAGSSFSTVGGVVVGNASVFSLAAGDPGDFGTPGASSQGSARVEAGASATSSFLSIGSPGGGNGRTGAETSTGNVVVDGLNSIWNVVRNSAQTGARALVALATGNNTTGSLTVSNGGTVRVDGSAAPGEFNGVNVAAQGAGAGNTNTNATATVTGAGSRLDFTGSVGFLNVGRGGGTGQMTISSGGTVGGSGNGETGLVYVGVGTGQGTGTLNISGSGSLLRMNGRNSTTNSDTTSTPGGGSFLSVGRTTSGFAGTGTLNISNGGRLEQDTRGVVLTNTAGQGGFGIGYGAGSTGTLNVTGPGSTLVVMSGTGLAPYSVIGRDGGNGSAVISNGGRIEITSDRISAPSASGYGTGEAVIFDVARRSGGTDGLPTLGTLTVTGAGSQLRLGGSADSVLNVGRGAGASGTLNILSGGQVQSAIVIIGNEGGTGTLTMNGGSLLLDRNLNGGPSAGQGGGLSVGRGGGIGTANIGGGSTVLVTSTSPSPGVTIGGSSTAIGGVGTVNVTGGSTVTASGPDARIVVGNVGDATTTGIGTLNISGAGSTVSATGSNSRVIIGAGANTIGTVNVGTGATLSAGTLVGVAHNGTSNTGGTGSLIVNGTVTAPSVVIGSAGVLTGSGVINGSVTNYGTINPGNSPGRLTINGGFENVGGKIVLEVQSLGGGQFAYDEIVFGDPANVSLGDTAIEFNFLGGTDPLAFQSAGLFDLARFFLVDNGSGGTSGISGAQLALFDNVVFSAVAGAAQLVGFSFNPDTGASLVPVPPTLALALLALALMAGAGRMPRRGGRV